MAAARALLPLLAFLLLSAVPSAAQTFKEFGSWQYVKGGGSEAVYTESTDEDRAFVLAANCSEGGLRVSIEFDPYLVDPERFGSEARLETWLDGQARDAEPWSFSLSSEKFENEKPIEFAGDLVRSNRMRVRIWDADDVTVGTYTFELNGASSAFQTISCYGNEAKDAGD